MRAIVVVVAALLAVPSTSARAAGPVAVMPFKNLTGQGELDWLRVGIAETLVADLQKDGSRKVVERAEIDRALAEIALQASQDSDEGLAAKAGRLVGAETVVVGGYQASGKGKATKLRLTARFVEVASGVVTETAKVDGDLADVFELQDEVVARLLKKPKRAPRPKATAPQQREKRVEAFRVFALAQSTSSQAEQIKYLREAVALDPDFVYATDQLYALERRLRSYRQDAARLQDAKARELLAVARDRTRPANERALAVSQALPGFAQQYRWGALLEVAEVIYAEPELPTTPTGDLREMASYYIFLSHFMLKATDVALQAGERHLKEFPTGTFSSSVSSQLQGIIDERLRRKDAREKIPAELADVDDDERKLDADIRERAERKQSPLPNIEMRRRVLAFRRCSVVYQGKDWDDAIRRCTAFAKAHPDDDEQHLARLARYFTAMSLAELGRFSEAKVIMKNLADEDAAWARSVAVPTMLSMWPQE